MSLSDSGKVLVIWSKWPRIVDEVGLQSTCEDCNKDITFMQMIAVMDSTVLVIKEQQEHSVIIGVFKLELPFVVFLDYHKSWIGNLVLYRMLHVDLTIATLVVEEEEDMEGFKHQIAAPLTRRQERELEGRLIGLNRD